MPQTIQRLETDTFCAGCGYNLHAQEVWLDDRLNIPVCRCPECGRHHPAGVGVSASNLWLKRLAAFALLIWVMIVVSVAVLWTFAIGGVQMGYVNAFTFTQIVATDGTPLTWENNGVNGTGYFNTKTHKVEMGPTHSVQVLDASKATFPVPVDDLPSWHALVIFCLGATLLGFVGGVLFAIVVWHWPHRRYAWLCVLPLIAFGVVASCLRLDVEYELVRVWGSTRAAMVMGWELLGMLIGLRVGRPIARTIARLVVPPKPRMLLAYLWHADGLAMPTTRPAEGRG